MDILLAYNIPWKGLANGSHHFDFEIGDPFFKAFGESVVKGGDLAAVIDMDKSTAMLMLDVRITGRVAVECDRCLGDLILPVDYVGELTVKFAAGIDDYDGEIMWLNPAESEIPLAQYLYESIVLGLPYRKVHGCNENGEPECDKEMLSRFRIISQEEFDSIKAEKHSLSDSAVNSKLARIKENLEKED